MNLNLSLFKFKYFDLYVSYHNEQKLYIDRFCNLFRKNGFRVWYDQFYMNNGINLFDESLAALTHSFVFVCFFSKQYMQSLKCRVEYATAIEQKMPIFCIIFEDLDLSQDRIFSGLLCNPHIELYNDLTLFDNLNVHRFNSILNDLQKIVNEGASNRKSYQMAVSAYYDTMI